MQPAETTQNPEAWACPARKRARVVCVASLTMSLALYAASPFMTLWTIASSVAHHDMPTLARTINWSSVDASLKEQILNGLNLGHVTEAADELPEFGESFATKVVSNAVDLNVTSENLGNVVDQAIAGSAFAVSAGTVFSAVSHALVRFTSANSFEAQVALPGHEGQTPLRVQLRIERWQWKLTRVDLPTAAPRPVIEASVQREHA